jgi:glycosyltransferase involved in cell wall biosynthesis
MIFEFKEGPSGGGYQFLRALRKYFIESGNYSENPDEADIYLFNGYQCIAQVAALKQRYPNKIFVHRVAGPIRLMTTFEDRRDFITIIANRLMADGTIFQSKWSKTENLRYGLKPAIFETIIMNSPDQSVFNRVDKKQFSRSRKIAIVATSWSANLKKGFKAYQWMDENLDFTKYEMMFIGNSPVKFSNIKIIPPLPSVQVAEHLKKSDIFITASEKDPCSNALIEALHCGLPAIVLKDGGHPEIIGKSGESFESYEEIPSLIERIADNYDTYQAEIVQPSMSAIANEYILFFASMLREVNNGNYRPKRITPLTRSRVLATIGLWKLGCRFPLLNRFIRTRSIV